MKRNFLNYLLLVFCQQVWQIVGIAREFNEFISDPINFSAKDSKVIQNTELPVVIDEVSVALRLNILNNHPNWACVFHKGEADTSRTPSLWLTPNNSAPHARFSTIDNWNLGIDSVDGIWNGFQSIQQVQTDKIIFNNGPLRIGNDTFWDGITGQISNFRYYNWRLSAEEVKGEYLNQSTISTISTIPTTQTQIPTDSITSSNNVAKSNDTAIMVGIGVGASLG
ncbi:569_t:CDS:2, partial [Ambispora gerdemannii]